MYAAAHRTLALAVLGFIAAIACPSVAGASQPPPPPYRDPQLGFTIVIPEGFRLEPSIQAAIPDCRLAAIRDEPDGGRTFFVVDSLRGMLRQEVPDPANMPGFKGRLLGFQWKGLSLTGAEVIESSAAGDFVNYNIQIPTKPEALLLRVFGPKAIAPELLLIARTALASVEADTNWNNNFPAGGGPSTARTTTMLVVLLGGIAVILVLASILSRRLPRGALLILFIGVWLVGQSIRTPTSNGRLISGAVTMLGAAGVLLGLVDAFRSRKPRPAAQLAARAATSYPPPPEPPPPPQALPSEPESPRL